MRFIETSIFTKRIVAAMPDDEYRLLQEALLRRPAHGDLIQGTGGVRKLRWGEDARGKSGGLRIIYYWHPGQQVFLMLFLYKKNEQQDLTADQRRLFAKVVKEEFK